MTEQRRTVSVVMNVTGSNLQAHLDLGWVECGQVRVGVDYESHLIEWPWDRPCVFPPRESEGGA